MKTILKKNQVIISVIAIMLIVAGYMNYTANVNQTLEAAALADTEQYATLGDATLVSANVADNAENSDNVAHSTNEVTTETQSTNEQASNDETTGKEDTSNNSSNTSQSVTSQTVNSSVNATVSPTASENQYFAESRLEREKMYSQMLESYQKILSSDQISDAQKEISENEIKNINDTKNAIMITENLIKNKGFEDLVIFINGDSINIVIKAKELTEEQIAQIQNIVTRELKGEIENIHISCKE